VCWWTNEHPKPTPNRTTSTSLVLTWHSVQKACHVAMLKSLQGTPLLDSVLSHHWIIISACSLCGCGLEPDATYLHQGWP
jgi:hypothetical protein